jgi:NAD(P)-dependent dehydrogenase (short-subunit alcohol dehydrogenase family)
MSLEGKGALVTGGGRGIGAAVARELAAAGARLVLAARTHREVEAVAAELRSAGSQAWGLAADVTDEAAVARLAAEAGELVGEVDILINNAGAASSAPLPKITLEEWNRLLAVNATSVFLVTRALLPAMAERGWGRVVNVASVAGKVGAPYIAAYAAAKHAVVGFTRAVAVEVAARGVTVNAVCPGYVDTALTEQTVARIMEKTGRDREETLAALAARSPQGRIYQPEEVAHLVVALCDPRSGGINGQAIVLDGGAVQS